MIAAKVSGAESVCARPGCAAIFGTVGYYDKAGWVLELSRRWYLDTSVPPARWRLGRHKRVWFGRTDSVPGATSAALTQPGHRLDGKYLWKVELPAVIECHKCSIVERVEIPNTDSPA